MSRRLKPPPQHKWWGGGKYWGWGWDYIGILELLSFLQQQHTNIVLPTDNLVFLTYLVLYFWPCVNKSPWIATFDIHNYADSKDRQTDTQKWVLRVWYKKVTDSYWIFDLYIFFSLVRGKYGKINTYAVEGREFLGLSYTDHLFMHQRR